jgi:guanylate kinase
MESLMPQATLFIVTAPSGAGKTSLVQALVESTDALCVSVSHTTRAPREAEVDGVNYNFVSQEQFFAMREAQEFFESAEVYGNFYGTSKTWVNEQLDSGTDVILEIDWQGARQVREQHPEACSIFILPPSLKALTERLTGRGQDDADTIARRMQQAVAEISHVEEADYIVVNDDFDKALSELRGLVLAQRLLADVQLDRLTPMLAELLAGSD